jgi:hypothetical protein
MDQQEPKRIAVAGDRVRAGVEFGGQVTVKNAVMRSASEDGAALIAPPP